MPVNSPGHAWYIRHLKTGGFLLEGSKVVFDPREATQFATRDEAVAAHAAFKAGSRATFPPCDVIDQTIPEPVPPDREPLVLKSFEEVLVEARARSAQVRTRAATGGGTPLLRTAPSPRPTPPPKGSPRPFGVGRFGLILQPKKV